MKHFVLNITARHSVSLLGCDWSISLGMRVSAGVRMELSLREEVVLVQALPKISPTEGVGIMGGCLMYSGAIIVNAGGRACGVPAAVATPAGSGKAEPTLIVAASVPSRNNTLGLQGSWRAGTVAAASTTGMVCSSSGLTVSCSCS